MPVGTVKINKIMNKWVSERVKERHWTCNLLMSLWLLPAAISVLFLGVGVGIFAIEENLLFGLTIIAFSVLVMGSAYGLLFRNRIGSLWTGAILLFTGLQIVAFSMDVVRFYNDPKYNDFGFRLSWVPESIVFSFVFSAIFLLFLALIMLIRKDGVSAWKNLERGGVVTKQGYEIAFTIIVCLTLMIYIIVRP